MLLRAILALPIFLPFFAHMLNPEWMAWSTVAIPVWIRSIGMGLGIMSLPLLWWLFRSIGKNISETVLTKREHKLVTDGPYAETRELFIGFYLFEVESLDEAIALARRIPISELGHVEVRPVVFSDSIALTSR